jgi:hypothetical protein
MVIFVVLGLVIAGVMLAPDLVIRVKARNRSNEEQTLTRLHDGLVRTMEKTQSIPAATNWSTAILPFVGQDQTEVQQVFPGFPSDANTARVFLMDPGLPNGLLPYDQAAGGLSGMQTNLLGTYARALLVSSTKRGLTLPVSSGTPSSNMFYSIWNWVFDPTTKSPPAFPTAWSGYGEFLHVKRVNLANQFHRVTMNHLAYGVGETSAATNIVNISTPLYFLRGTRLWLARTDGTLARIHVVNRDVSFDFGALSGPVAWFKFVETSGTLATNSGSLGASANGVYANSVTLNVAGPRPPAYSGYASNNTAASFDGANDYILGTNNLMNNFTAFTIAGWINPAAASLNNQDLFGQLDIVGFVFTTAGKLELHCNSTKKVHYFYPYGRGWRQHVYLCGRGGGGQSERRRQRLWEQQQPVQHRRQGLHVGELLQRFDRSSGGLRPCPERRRGDPALRWGVALIRCGDRQTRG